MAGKKAKIKYKGESKYAEKIKRWSLTKVRLNPKRWQEDGQT